MIWFCLVSLLNDISTFVGYFNVKAILLEEQWSYLTHRWEDKGVYIFPQEYLSESECNSASGVRTRLLQFEVHRFNYYITGTPHSES